MSGSHFAALMFFTLLKITDDTGHLVSIVREAKLRFPFQPNGNLCPYLYFTAFCVSR